MFYSSLSLILLVTLIVTPSTGQTTCENSGDLSGSVCSCPPGFGGSTCSSPACAGNIFQGKNRSIISDASATSFGNLTSSGCSCQDGWTGTGCNVCKSATSCQSAYTAVNGTSSSSSSSSGIDGLDGSSSDLNSSLTCNSEPRIWAAGEMSCQVVVRALLYSNVLLEVDLSDRTQLYRLSTLSTPHLQSSVPSTHPSHHPKVSPRSAPPDLSTPNCGTPESNNFTVPHLHAPRPHLPVTNRPVGHAITLHVLVVPTRPSAVACLLVTSPTRSTD